jgi:hypothetical protein
MGSQFPLIASVAWIAMLGSTYPAIAECAPFGRAGSTPEWNAAFCDLIPSLNLKKGQKVTIGLAAPAPKAVIARLVPDGCATASPCTILGSCKNITVQNGVVEVVLEDDYPKISQISIHSGVGGKAWGCSISGGAMSTIQSLQIQPR